MKFKSLLTLFGCVALWGMLTSTLRNPNNPPLGNTGAPSETTCQKSGCHASVGNFTGTVSLSGLPDTVAPDQTYMVTLTQTSNAVKAGFQLTCLDAANTKCGTLTAGAGSSLGTLSSRQYVRQSAAKTLS
ncbi:MAG: choice-of-anchor V domain-containing protein, partial [Saprospiraceae bacterium]